MPTLALIKEKRMLLLGIDVGTSSIKVSVVDSQTQKSLASTQYPAADENRVITVSPAWAEQDPNTWWEQVQLAVKELTGSGKFNPKDICAIGIAFQMRGLVLV